MCFVYNLKYAEEEGCLCFLAYIYIYIYVNMRVGRIKFWAMMYESK